MILVKTELTERYKSVLRSLTSAAYSHLPSGIKAHVIEAVEDNKRVLEREIAREMGCEDTYDLRFLQWVAEVSREVRKEKDVAGAA